MIGSGPLLLLNLASLPLKSQGPTLGPSRAASGSVIGGMPVWGVGFRQLPPAPPTTLSFEAVRHPLPLSFIPLPLFEFATTPQPSVTCALPDTDTAPEALGLSDHTQLSITSASATARAETLVCSVNTTRLSKPGVGRVMMTSIWGLLDVSTVTVSPLPEL